MAVSISPRPKCHHTRAILTYLVVHFSFKVLGSVVSVPGENSLLSQRDEWDAWSGQDSASTDVVLASASQDNLFDGSASDECLFALPGCPLAMDPNPSAVDFGQPDEVGDGGCDETLGDCTSLFDEGPTTPNIDNLDIPSSYDGGVDMASGVTASQDGSASEAQDVKDRQPRIYYDCAPDYTGCLIYDRSKGPNFNLKANVFCPSDVDLGGIATADTNSKLRGSPLLGLPGSQCEFCLENGASCEILDCDIAYLPSKYNNWGQTWGTCNEQSCSCTNNIKALDDDVNTELVASSDNPGWFR